MDSAALVEFYQLWASATWYSSVLVVLTAVGVVLGVGICALRSALEGGSDPGAD